jgi:hypothetical protein
VRKQIAIGLTMATAGILILNRLGHRWGATDEEIEMSLPGDELLHQPMDRTNHAVTIKAAAEDIWPWLVQTGYHRGGWYSDTKWDRIMDKYIWQVIVPPEERAEWQPSANRILPEFQQIEIGDIIPDGAPGTAFFTVEDLKPNGYLVLHSNSHFRYIGPGFLRDSPLEPYGEFSWVFYLYNYGPNQTRLILRTRARYGPLLIRIISWPLLMLGEYLFPRQILLGIKKRVETLPSIVSTFAQIKD